jgi:hypothetical protein
VRFFPRRESAIAFGGRTAMKTSLRFPWNY